MKIISSILKLVALLIFGAGVLFGSIGIASGGQYVGNGLLVIVGGVIGSIFAYGFADLFDAVDEIRNDTRRSADALEALAKRQRPRPDQ